ncbi:MAG: hypothetical protein Q9174_006245, partial [Haloplaca sp. 1 TL-2023]
TQKSLLLRSLRAHNINTLSELRRIERLFSALNAPDTEQPMREAWTYYVDSNTLLNELRGLTKTYPFGEGCLDEAKNRVNGNGGNGSQGGKCFKVLKEIREKNLIPHHARLLAAKPAMWGNRTPTATEIDKLTSVLTTEWTRALGMLLRHWE